MDHQERAFVWRTRMWNNNSADTDQIDFGLISDGKWDGKVSALWLRKTDQEPLFREGMTGFVLIRRFVNLSTRLEELTEVGVSAEQFSVILAECGFKDYTIYTEPKETVRDLLQRELRKARETVDFIEDRLATGYYPHT